MIRRDVQLLVWRARLEPWNFDLICNIFHGYLHMARVVGSVKLLKYMYDKRVELYSLDEHHKNVSLYGGAHSRNLDRN